MSVEITVAVSMACALLGAAMGYAGQRRAVRKEDAERGRADGVMMEKLNHVISSTDKINVKLDAQEARNIEVISRLTAVEASAKQAHKRLDDMCLSKQTPRPE